jgi:CheY-like chemotaxis protein
LLEAFQFSVSQFGRTADETMAQRQMDEFLQNTRTLREKAGLVSVPVWQMASLLEGLLKQIAAKPDSATPTTVRTMVGAIELLHPLCTRGIPRDLLNAPRVRLLAVDDDPISLHNLAITLKKSLTEPDQAADGPSAIKMAEAYPYDAVFLDIEMPEMDGFKVSARIHSTARNQSTPVVFVTSHSDLEDRARSLLVGAHDFVSKPFLGFELALKALTVVLRGRLKSHHQPIPGTAASPRASSAQTAPSGGSVLTARSSVSVIEPV